ncbi:DUF1007 family protein [Arcobacter sp. LA11]|uniref:DUF1007 family protein n=1 Tax=Arcobacter sp. LA11 TaxID=1898176 RepID=UPI000933AEFB|nr:DUF1007 family protein [Arcobacter sp. LA11]
MNHVLKTIILLMLLFTKVFSHPHTFIEVKPTIEIKNEKIDKLHIKWILDEMTSMMLIMELDEDANGKFDKNENTYIYKNYFSSLEKQNFYMKILSNKSDVSINPKNFKASIEKDKLIYSFDIEQKIDTKNLKIDFEDEELFVGMMLEKDYIKLRGVNKSKMEQLKKEIFGVN